MNIIDENIVFSQRQRLTELRIHYKQIGFEIGRLGMKDLNNVIVSLSYCADLSRHARFIIRNHEAPYEHP